MPDPPARYRRGLSSILGMCLLVSPVWGSGVLEEGFADPPREARPMVWWHWINGNVTKEGIAADLEDMRRVGLAGVQMFDVEIYLPPGPVRYGSDRWHEAVQFAIRKADELGLEFCMMNTPGWSASGGPWVTPERSMKRVVWTETETDGGAVAITLAPAEGKLGFYRDIAVVAVPVTSERLDKLPAKVGEAAKPVTRTLTGPATAIAREQVIMLSERMDASGKLSADLPPGRWVILRFGFTTTGRTNHPAVPEGKGLEIDKLDADAVAFQFENALGRVIREAGPLAGKTFTGILFDSFEGGPQNWTDQFPDAFRKLKGYDILPFLPLITGRIIGSPQESEAVLWDFRQVLEELLAENYFGTMHRLAAEHGIKIYAESQGGPLNPMSANRHVDVPMNEFWVPGVADRASRIKMTVSAAGYLGRRIVGAESFTATPENGRYLAVPSSLKMPGDYAFTLGINRFIFHHYTHQPVSDAAPGFALGRYGTHFGRLNTWWPYAGAWISYLSRSQFLLQHGRTFADVCMLVDEDMGYGFPSKMAGIVPGFDFDVCYPPDLRAMSMRKGRLEHPRGQSYALLVTPEKWVAEITTLRHLRGLVKNGLVLCGQPPDAPAGWHDLEHEDEFLRLSAEIWGEPDGKSSTAEVRAGRVLRGVPPLEALKQIGLAPDLSWTPADAEIRFIHRQSTEGDVYFVFSNTDKPVSAELTFRQEGRRPEVWDPVTASRAEAPVFALAPHGLSVPVQFEPFGSIFVVFRKPLPPTWIAGATPVNLELKNGEILANTSPVSVTFSDGTRRELALAARPPDQTLTGPWKVRFADGRGAPSETVFETLTSWSDHADPGIRYYSGSGIYTTDFSITAPLPGQKLILDLGRVADIARVRVNGKPAGVLWKPPFRADITDLITEGANRLEVSVANRWINRIIGDEAIPVDFTYQKPGTSKFTDGRIEKLPDWLYDPAKAASRQRRSFSTWKHFDADSPIVDGGLIGPVSLEWYDRVDLSSLTR